MAKHDSSVNYENLVRDLAEMYPFNVAEVVLVELIANSLDARATRISIDYDASNKILIVEDNGKGMSDKAFKQYHDFAAGLKRRGDTIGFAGVGAKISFNIADRVITQTRSEDFVGGSNWYLESPHHLVWEDIPSNNISLPRFGTRVEVHFRSDADIPYDGIDRILEALHRHYLPLFDKKFLEVYDRLQMYSSELRFVVNGSVIEPFCLRDRFEMEEFAEIKPQNNKGQIIGYGVLGISRREYPVHPDLCGVVVCTHGKVVKSDIFEQFVGDITPKILGVVEVPKLVKFLTTAKTDFKRGISIREFESYYGPIREAFKEWLKQVGIVKSNPVDEKEVRKLESELRRLMEWVPELANLFSGLTTKKIVLAPDLTGDAEAPVGIGAQITFPQGDGVGGHRNAPLDHGPDTQALAVGATSMKTSPVTPIARRSRQGPRITFANQPERVDIAWVEGDTVVINSAHAAYQRVRGTDLARRVFSVLAIGYAVHKFLESSGTAAGGTDVLDRLMDAWGKERR